MSLPKWIFARFIFVLHLLPQRQLWQLSWLWPFRPFSALAHFPIWHLGARKTSGALIASLHNCFCTYRQKRDKMGVSICDSEEEEQELVRESRWGTKELRWCPSRGLGGWTNVFFLEPLHLFWSMVEINRAGLDLYVSCAELLQLCNCSHCQKRKSNHGQVACDDTCFSILLVAVAYNPRWSQLCEDVLLSFALENLASVTWLNTAKIRAGNFFPSK